mgnify:CR=1 FL=1
MKNYNQELDVLFDEWEEKSEENGLSGFCRDGLLNKGKIFSHVNEEDGKTYWGREKKNENELWYNATRKILFLLKDTNSNPNEDMRCWIGRQHPTIISNRFFKNIALWFYGINSFQQNGTYISFKNANNPIEFSKHFDDLPIALVNVKKESGGATVSDDTLLQYVGLTSEENKIYGDCFGNYLRRQVAEILMPNIIVCGGGVKIRVILEIVKKIIFPNLNFTKFDNWIYYNDEKNIILIDSYHPANRYSYEDVYEEMMKSLQQFYRVKRIIRH